MQLVNCPCEFPLFHAAGQPKSTGYAFTLHLLWFYGRGMYIDALNQFPNTSSYEKTTMPRYCRFRFYRMF